ncbi:MAG: Ig-like domain-containing protein [Planctomycetota bacterium]
MDAIESGDLIREIVLSVDGLEHGGDEKLTIDNHVIELVDANSESTASGIQVNVSVSGSVATVTILQPSGLSTADTEALLNGLSYHNTSESIVDGFRDVTLVSITDDGGGSDTHNNGTVSRVTVLGINDAPMNSGSLPSDVTMTEDIAGNLDLSAINLADLDDNGGNLTLRISTATGGNLSAFSQPGIAISGDGTGSVTLTGTLADLNNYLNTPTNLTYLHGVQNTNGNDADSVTVEISDNGNTGAGGGGFVDLGSINIDITAVNDAPVAILPISLNATEQTNLELIGAGLSIADIDSDTSIVTITLNVGEGVLHATTGNSGVLITDSGTATMTLSGTVEEINALFDGSTSASLSYFNGSNSPSASTDLTMVVNDRGNTGIDPGSSGDDFSEQDTAVTTIHVADTNDAPLTGTSYTNGSEDNGVSIILGGTDSDGTIEHFILSSLPANGTLYTDVARTNPVATGVAIPATGGTLSLYFDPDQDWNGVTTFEYAAQDDAGLVDSTPATGTITIDPVNDAPTVSVNTLNVNEGDTGRVITNLLLAEGDVDDDGADVTFRITELPVNGILRLNGTALGVNDTFTQADVDNNRVTYDHDDSETTIDGFRFDVLDGGEDGASPLLDQAFDISITLQNEDPFNTGSLPASLTVNEDVTTNIDFSAIDLQDPDGTLGELTITFSTTGGGTLDSNPTAAVTVVGNGSNTLSVTGTLAELNALLDDPNSLRFTGAPNANGLAADSIRVEVTDNGNTGIGGGGTISLGSTTINIDAVNDEQVLDTNIQMNLDEGATQTLLRSMLETTDVDNNPVEIVYYITAAPRNGTLLLLGTPTATFTQADINAGIVSYEHNGGESTSDTFDFFVDDRSGSTTSSTFNISIAPANDNPVAQENTYSLSEGGTINVSGINGILTNDSDVDGDPLTVELVSGPIHGSLTLNPDGSFEYMHDGSETTLDSFTYRVNDDQGGQDTAEVHLNIEAVNDRPLAEVDHFNVLEDGSLNSDVLANDFDAESDILTAELISDVNQGTLNLNADGTFTYTPDANFNGSDSFTYRASDGIEQSVETTVTVTVVPVNDRPDGTGDSFTTTNLEALVIGGMGVLANDSDIDDDPLSVVLLNPPAEGNVSLSPDGTFTFTPQNSFVGTTNFTYMITDGAMMSEPVTVTINVIPFGGITGGPGDSNNTGDSDSYDNTGDSTGESTESVNEEVTQDTILLIQPTSATVSTEEALGSVTRSDSLEFSSQEVQSRLLQKALDLDRDEELDSTVLRKLNLQEITIEFQKGLEFGQVNTIAVDTAMLWSDLDEAQQELEEEILLERFVSGATLLATTGIAAGYIFWILRGSFLIALMASSVPAWAMVDPLPVLKAMGGNKTADGDYAESLVDMIQGAPAGA